MSQPTRILLALVLGLAIGIGVAQEAPRAAAALLPFAGPIGTTWLNALQMTIIPLVVSLLVTGIAATAEAVRAGRTAARAIATILAVMFASSAIAAVITPLFLRIAPLPTASAASLRAALADVPPPGPPPAVGEFFTTLVPTNIVAASANSAFLSIIIFTLLFAFALTRIDREGRAALTAFFKALRDTMLVIIGWIIWVAPLGVFALAFSVGAKAGGAAFGALLHYVAVISAVGIVIGLSAYLVAMLGARVGFARFARGALPSQAVAISTQSSLASLPTMLKGAEALGVPAGTSGVVLPLAVVMMRATGPAMNLAVAIYVATWFGAPVGGATLVAAAAIATLTSLGSVSLPGQVSFFSGIGPVTAAFGAPLAPLGLLVAVETIPDIFRTLGNVTMDLAVTLAVSARSRPAPTGEADRLLAEERT